jgi:hypothetical protein
MPARRRFAVPMMANNWRGGIEINRAKFLHLAGMRNERGRQEPSSSSAKEVVLSLDEDEESTTSFIL